MNHEAEHRRRDAIAAMVERERLELQNAPVINVVTDTVLRCHGCGKVADQLYELSGPQHPTEKLPSRLMCMGCHPGMREKIWTNTEDMK